MSSDITEKWTGSSAQKKNCKPVPHIPSPIIGDILSYLPLKTVVQSKLLCKEWENLISDPDFAKSHFLKSPRGLFFYSKILGNVLHFVDLRNSSRFKIGRDIYIPHKAIVGRFLSTKIDFGKCSISSCNGFLCFYKTDPNPSYYICNPITRDYTIIPAVSAMSSDRPRIFPRRGWSSEFGFSPKTGQFKVLRRLPYRKSGMILTLGQRSWRSIDIPNYFKPYGKNVFLNGAFHWLSFRDTILSFDVGAETFHEFPFPPMVRSEDGKLSLYYYSLGILEECLSLCRANYVKGRIDIWMLKEYGITESWIKKFVINDAGKFVKGIRVLWFMEDGEKGKNVLLVCTHNTMVTYDPTGGVCSVLKFDGIWESLALFPHTPCLTPLKDVIIFDEISKEENEEMSPEQSVNSKARPIY